MFTSRPEKKKECKYMFVVLVLGEEVVCSELHSSGHGVSFGVWEEESTQSPTTRKHKTLTLHHFFTRSYPLYLGKRGIKFPCCTLLLLLLILFCSDTLHIYFSEIGCLSVFVNVSCLTPH